MFAIFKNNLNEIWDFTMAPTWVPVHPYEYPLSREWSCEKIMNLGHFYSR
jgi:hypothetical protein